VLTRDPGKNRELSDYATMGTMFPVSMAVGLAIGYYLDRWLHTAPWLVMIFSLLGIAAGFINMFQVMKKHEKK